METTFCNTTMETIQIKQELDIKLEQDFFLIENDQCTNHNLEVEQFVTPDNTVDLKLELDSLELSEKSFDGSGTVHDEPQGSSDEDWSPKKKRKKIVKKRIISNPFKSGKKHNERECQEDNRNEPIKLDNGKLKCPYCGKEATILGNLKRHIREIHVKKEIFMCRFCSYQSSRRTHLNIHINTIHTKEKTYKCSYCEFEAFSPNTLRNHLNHIHTLHRWYNCDLCEFKTTHSGNLRVHIENKHNTAETIIKCKHCDFVANKKSQLNIHIDRVHQIEKLICSFCGYVGKIRSQLGKHIAKKHPEQAKFKCKLCDYKGLNEGNLRAHVAAKHQDYKISHSCSDCDATYDCFANLKKHRNVKHT